MRLHHVTAFGLLALPLDAVLLATGVRSPVSIPVACLGSAAIVWITRKRLDKLAHPPQLPPERFRDLSFGNRRERRARSRRKRR